MSVETSGYLAMLRRMLRAAGKRVAEADEYEFRELLALQQELDAAIGKAVEGQLASRRSWADIGQAVGISKQAAHQRFSRFREG